MSRGRAALGPVLAVLLAGLMVLSIPGVVVPALGTGAYTAHPPLQSQIATPTVTPPALDETDNDTTVTTAEGATPTYTPQRQHLASDDLQAVQQRTLHSARTLMKRSKHQVEAHPDNLSSAVRLTKDAMMIQVAILDPNQESTTPSNVTLPVSPTPDHAAPSGAVFAIFEQYDVTMTAKQATKIRALDDLPEPTRSELTDVLDAYLGYYMATRAAYADANWTRLRTLANASESRLQTVENDSLPTPDNGPYSKSAFVANQAFGNGNASLPALEALEATGFDVTKIRAAQVRLLEETVDLNTALEQADAPQLATPASHPVNQFGIQEGPISINLSTHNNTYNEDYALQIDRGGNDTYDNNAGGASGPIKRSAALIDFGGNDSYNGRNGGGQDGSGFLVDAEGDDIYTAGSAGTNGGGRNIGATGFLLDISGNDIYTAGSGGTNGGGTSAAVGFLVDASGTDSYNAKGQGTNGGGYVGMGFLLDAAESDTYNATDTATNGGGAAGGVGSLIDLEGDDRYTAGRRGVNGGAATGFLGLPIPAVGMLVDAGGDDSYKNESGGHGDDFRVNKKGTVGVQVDLQATNTIPDSGPPSTPSTTSGFTADLCVEGLRDTCDGDGTVGQRENADGDDVNGTIRGALSAAEANQSIETIEVRPETYHENLTVTTSNLTLVANASAAPGDVVLDGGSGTADPREDLAHAFQIRASNVTIAGFVIRNYTSDEIAVTAPASRTHIRENAVHGSIAVTESNATAIRANRIDQNNTDGAGLTVSATPNATISNNTLTGSGLTLADSMNATVRQNTVKDVTVAEDDGPVSGLDSGVAQSTAAGDSQQGSVGGKPVGISITGGHNVTVAENTVHNLKESTPRDGPIGIALVATSSPRVTNNSVDDLSESGAGDGPAGIAVVDVSSANVTDNAVDILNEAGAGAGPAGITFESSTLAVPIAHNEVTNLQASGDGRTEVGVHIVDSTLDSPLQPFESNAYENSGGILIANSTVSPIDDNTFALNISIVNDSYVTSITNNTFDRMVTIVASTVEFETNNTFSGGMQVYHGRGVTLANGTFSGRGLEVYNSTNIRVANNRFNYVNFTLQHTNNSVIAQNTIAGGAGMLKLIGTTGTSVVHNTVEGLNETANGRAVGIDVMNGTGTTISKNSITNLFGYPKPSIGIRVTGGKGTVISSNKVIQIEEVGGSRGPVGILIKQSENSKVSDNSVRDFLEQDHGDGPVGIGVTGSTATVLSNNSISDLIERESGIGPAGVKIRNADDTIIASNSITNLVERATDGFSARETDQTTSDQIFGIMMSNTTHSTISHNYVSRTKAIKAYRVENGNRWVEDYRRTEGDGLRLMDTAESRVTGNAFSTVNNSVVIDSTTPAATRITHNRFAGNGTYGVQNLSPGVINATYNYWGAPSGPQSPRPSVPLADPVTGAVANGRGGLISVENETLHLANVHFDPYIGMTGSPGDRTVEGTCVAGDRDDRRGPDENADGDTFYGSIQSAVDAAAPGDTIVVIPCTYRESVTVEAPNLTIRTPSTATVLTGSDELVSGFRLNASGVEISSFTVRNYTGSGIAVTASGATLRGNKIVNNLNGTTVADDVGDTIVRNNTFHGNGIAGLALADGARAATIEVHRNVFGGYPVVRCTGTGNDCHVTHRDNGKYALYNANETGIVNATYNHWGWGNGPSSPGSGQPLADPVTAGSANGTGGAVSAGMNGASNVHFYPFTSLTFAADLVVDDNAWECPDAGYSRIEPAMSAASTGATVAVCPGRYDGISLNKKIKLRGAAPHTTTIVGKSGGSSYAAVEIAVSNFGTLQGFTLTTDGGGRGIELKNGEGTIKKNIISGNWAGIHAPKQDNSVAIKRNNITNNDNGFFCLAKRGGCPSQYSGQMSTHKNLILDNDAYGIYNSQVADFGQGFVPQPIAVFPGTNNIWACGGPSGGHRDWDSAHIANGTGDRVNEQVNWHPFYELTETCLSIPSPPPLTESNNSAPAVDRLSVAEIEKDEPASDAVFEVRWRVNDSDGNLDSVNVTLTDDSAGETEATDTEQANGDEESRTQHFTAPGDDGSGHNYTVNVTVWDEEDATDTAIVTITETEPEEQDSGWPSNDTSDGDDGETEPSGDGTGGAGTSGNGTGTSGSGTNGTTDGDSGSDPVTTDDGESGSDPSPQTAEPQDATATPSATASATPPDTPTETPSVTPPQTPTPEVIPGFGVAVWVVGFIVLLGLAVVRRRRD